ncbi:MAG: hypothetical protein AB1498_04785 [bacterium]
MIETSLALILETEIPVAYYLNWLGLVLIGIIVSIEIKEIRKEKPENYQHKEDENTHNLKYRKYKPKIKALIFVIISFAVFYTEQLPVLSGKADLKQAGLVYEFHESLLLGFLKLFVKVLLKSFNI